jgi:7-cyano-7-deazaguanine synthase
MSTPDSSLAALISGGLDSAILVGDAVRQGIIVHPLYVRCGLHWESEELQHLQRFLGAIAAPNLCPLHLLEMPVADLYDSHWSITGRDVPNADSPDAAVYLPGRNVLLLSKALLWCHLHGVLAVAVGSLDTNPFPDATPAFFEAFSRVVNQAVGGAVAVIRPFTGLDKTAVMRRGEGLPLGLTFSCMRPADGEHCGACNKCQERRVAFQQAGMADPTAYHAAGESVH